MKLNIINEEAKRNLSNQILIKKISIDSRSIKKNDVFCAIKGKKVDGNTFVSEAFKKKNITIRRLSIIEKNLLKLGYLRSNYKKDWCDYVIINLK